jgi:hypothetical protein
LLVAGFGNAVAADYAAFARGQADRNPTLVADPALPDDVPPGPLAVVVFLPPRLTEPDRARLDALLALAVERQAHFVGLVSTFRTHFGDRAAAEVESHALERLGSLRHQAVVFRPGHVLSPHSPASASLRRLGPCYPLVPGRLRSSCVEGDELFAAIEAARRDGRPHRSRLITLLGPNRPWRAVLAEHRGRGLLRACLTALSALLSLTLAGHLAALALALLARRRPALRCWNFDTLRPGSFRELLALYNPCNYRHVKVVGYNNGVRHFGQRHPGRTVVSTVHCNRVVRAAPAEIKADCGATIRRARDFAAAAGQELYVIPNYSYVCLGTAFFVPIHGSAADYSCVAETITRVTLYDPVLDRLVVARPNEPAFRDAVYNMKADVLLLRLCLRVKPQSHYYVRRQELDSPTSTDLLGALRDSRATNVEIRKPKASGSKVQVCKYYKDPSEAQSPVLDVPRDSLGRLWDRLEEGPVTSFLMHALTRHLVWHAELFFTADEFATFWKDHAALPLRKIQLRYLHRDGFPHSPFRDQDCVSADLFVFRRHRRALEAYLRRTFAVVRTNPGKQSF